MSLIYPNKIITAKMTVFHRCASLIVYTVVRCGRVNDTNDYNTPRYWAAESKGRGP